MMRYIRDLRLIPIALIASACLLVLKSADLALNGSSLLGSRAPPPDAGEVAVIRPAPDATAPSGAKLSWARQMFNFPDGSGAAPATASIAPPRLAAQDAADITGSVTTQPAAANPTAPADAKNAADAAGALGGPPGGAATLPPPGTLIPTNGTVMPTGAERAVLERLQQRREELDARARELDIRESLIQSAEKRMEAKLAELKDIESRIKVETQQKDGAEAARLKSLVTMYENMKPRDAAKIFNRLDTNVLIEVSSLINPRQMAEILAQMSPEVAEKLTVELADKAQAAAPSGNPAELPKIEGQPTPQ